jgi:hypothetical protein
MFSLQPYRDVFTGGPEQSPRTEGAYPHHRHSQNRR